MAWGTLLRVARAVLLGYGGWLALLFVAQRFMIFPGQRIVPVPGVGAPGVERIWLDTDQGRVEAWFLPGEGVRAEAPGPMVVYAHGNGELIEYARQMVEGYRRLGVSVLLPEFRGYGRSAGSPSESAIVDDYRRFVELAVTRPDVDPERVVFHGRSLGGGVIAALTAHRRPRALILESTFSSLAPIARRYFAPSFLLRDRFDSAEAIAGLDLPILLIHGERDQVVPFPHAKRLEAAAKHVELVRFPDGHNDLPSNATLYWQKIGALLSGAGVIAGPS